MEEKIGDRDILKCLGKEETLHDVVFDALIHLRK
jgi:hypothetical protein